MQETFGECSGRERHISGPALGDTGFARHEPSRTLMSSASIRERGTITAIGVVIDLI